MHDVDGVPIAGAEVTARFALARKTPDNVGANPLRDAGVVGACAPTRRRVPLRGASAGRALPVDVRLDGQRFPTSTRELAAAATEIDRARAREPASHAPLDFQVRDEARWPRHRSFTLTGLPQSGSAGWDVHQQAFEARDGRTLKALVAGAWLVSIDAPGYASGARARRIALRQARPGRRSVAAARSLRVRVIEPDGRPRADALLLLSDAAVGRCSRAPSNANHAASRPSVRAARPRCALCPRKRLVIEVLTAERALLGQRFESICRARSGCTSSSSMQRRARRDG